MLNLFFRTTTTKKVKLSLGYSYPIIPDADDNAMEKVGIDKR
jgi:hypothetical protein